MHPQTLSFSKQIHPVDPTPPPGPPPNLCLLAKVFSGWVFYNTAVAALSIEWKEEIRRRNGKGLEGALGWFALERAQNSSDSDWFSVSLRLRFSCENIQGLPLSMKVHIFWSEWQNNVWKFEEEEMCCVANSSITLERGAGVHCATLQSVRRIGQVGKLQQFSLLGHRLVSFYGGAP